MLLLGLEMEGTSSDPESLMVRVRVFNPHDQAVTLRPSDVYVIFSPVVVESTFPIGPMTSSTGVSLPLVLRRGEARDIELHFAWAGEPYVGFAIGSYRIIAVLYEEGR